MYLMILYLPLPYDGRITVLLDRQATASTRERFDHRVHACIHYRHTIGNHMLEQPAITPSASKRAKLVRDVRLDHLRNADIAYLPESSKKQNAATRSTSAPRLSLPSNTSSQHVPTAGY